MKKNLQEKEDVSMGGMLGIGKVAVLLLGVLFLLYISFNAKKSANITV